MHGQVGVRGIERGALGVLGVEACEVEEQVAIDVGRGEEDLAELQLPAQLSSGRDPLEGAKQAAVAHAVRDDVHSFGPAARGEIHQEISDRPLAGLDGRLVGRVGRHAAARRPTEERGRARHFQVEADLRRGSPRWQR